MYKIWKTSNSRWACWNYIGIYASFISIFNFVFRLIQICLSRKAHFINYIISFDSQQTKIYTQGNKPRTRIHWKNQNRHIATVSANNRCCYHMAAHPKTEWKKNWEKCFVTWLENGIGSIVNGEHASLNKESSNISWVSAFWTFHKNRLLLWYDV